MMIPPIFTLARRGVIPGSVLALCLVSVSCKLPPREAWNQVQQRGLLPVLFQPAPSSTPATPHRVVSQVPAGPDEALKVQPVRQAEIAKNLFATPVPGRPGYVFSPHVPGNKIVDVSPFAAGTEVRCPYTMQPFQVPDFTVPAPPLVRPQPQRSIAEIASHRADSQTLPAADQVPLLIPTPNPLPAATSALPEIPLGSRVPGRPGFVYSPFAQKNQLVDVAGIAPGVEVKCPYSNQLFRVPEPLPEEMIPAPEKILPQELLPSIQSPAPVETPAPAQIPDPSPPPSPPEPVKPPTAP